MQKSSQLSMNALLREAIIIFIICVLIIWMKTSKPAADSDTQCVYMTLKKTQLLG